MAHDLDDIENILNAGEIPATRIYSIADIFKDPHFKARNAIVRVKDEALGNVALAAPVPRLSRTPGEIRHQATFKRKIRRKSLLASSSANPKSLRWLKVVQCKSVNQLE